MNPFSGTTKKILLASYYFPPDAAVGGLRTAKFARFLPPLGWQPFVLTTQDRFRERMDLGRMRGLEDVKIIKTSELPTLRGAYLRLKTVLSKLESRTASSSEGVVRSDQPATENIPGSESPWDKIKRYVISMMMLLPDDRKNWAIPASLRAVYEVRRRGIDCVLTSGPPASSHLIGIVVKAFTKAKWVADFRDPWLDMVALRSPLTRTSLSDGIEKRMESLVMEKADRVITVTEIFRDTLRDRYPHLSPEKFQYIPNGIDMSRFPPSTGTQKYDRFTITYTGALYFDRTPEPVFAAVRELIRRGEIGHDDLRIKLVGECRFIDGRETVDVARSFDLEDIVEITDPVPYSEALTIMRRSHTLLLIAPPHHRLMIPAKFFDYLGAGTRILGLTEDGATSRIISSTKSGASVSPSQIEGIVDFIREEHKAWREKREGWNDQGDETRNFPEYDIRTLTKNLSKELERITDAK